MTEKLTITGSADLLAVVPHLLGTHPTESFVVLTARAGSLGATMRVDAPAESQPLDYAQVLTTYAAHDEQATASYIIVYSDETGADGQAYPYTAHVAALTRELATARMPVRNGWLVTGTHWSEFGADEQLPLDQITDSNANATLTYFGSATDIDLYNPALLGNLPEVGPRPTRMSGVRKTRCTAPFRGRSCGRDAGPLAAGEASAGGDWCGQAWAGTGRLAGKDAQERRHRGEDSMEHLSRFAREFVKALGNLLPVVVVVVVVLFQAVVFRSMPDAPLEKAAGLLIVAAGIALFLHGLDLSVFPVGKNLANQFVRRGALGLLLPFGFAIGFAALDDRNTACPCRSGDNARA